MRRPSLIDLSMKELIRLAPHALFRLAQIDVDPGRARLEDSVLSTRELRADHVFTFGERGDPGRWALHLEYQLHPKRGELYRWLIKNLRLNEQLRCPVPLLVLYLTRGRRRTFPDRLEVTAAGLESRHYFSAVRLWEHAERIRSGELRELAPLLVLCEPGPTEATLREERRLLQDESVPEAERPELLALALAVGSRYFRRELLERVFQEDLEMLKEVGLVEEWLRERELLGREQGREEGREEGREQGSHQEALRFTREVLSKRFGELPPAVDVALQRCTSAELRALTLAALDAESLSELNLPG